MAAIALGSGNYNAYFTASNAWGAEADNTVHVAMGRGADNLVLTGSNNLTRAVIRRRIGHRSDELHRDEPATSSRAACGERDGDVSGGGGHDSFVAGTGSLTITDPTGLGRVHLPCR